MKFDEAINGPYRIYVGALDTPGGDGHMAAVVVHWVGQRACEAGAYQITKEVFRDDCLSCGHRWPTADAALRFALRKARDWIAQQHQPEDSGAAHSVVRAQVVRAAPAARRRPSAANAALQTCAAD